MSASQQQAEAVAVEMNVCDHAYVAQCLQAGEGKGVLYFALNISDELSEFIYELDDCVELNMARTGFDIDNFALVDRFKGVIRYRAFFLWRSIRNKLMSDNAHALAIATVEAGFDASTDASVSRIVKNRLFVYSAEELQENSDSYDGEGYAKLRGQLLSFYKEYDQTVKGLGECLEGQWFVLREPMPTGTTLTLAIRHSDPQLNNQPEIIVIIEHDKWSRAEEEKVQEIDIEYNCDSYAAW
jgi:hypothetical protein